MIDEHVSRVLKMLEEGKISAADADALISTLRATSSSAAPPPPPKQPQQPGQQSQAPPPSGHPAEPPNAGPARIFEFGWGQKSKFPLNLDWLGKQISDAVHKIDPERIVRDATAGVSREGKRFRERMRTWASWCDEDMAPQNTAGQPSARSTETHTYQLTPEALIQVENHWGDITVAATTGPATLRIERETWAATPEEASALLTSLHVQADTFTTGRTTPFAESQQPAPSASDDDLAEDIDDSLPEPPPFSSPTQGPPPPPLDEPADRFEVQVAAPEGWRCGRAELYLNLPEGCTLRLATSFGVVTVENTAGRVEAQTVSGAISLHNLRGEVHAESISGNISTEDLRATATLTSKDGDIEATRLFAGVDTNTVSGDIRIASVEGGRVSARSVSGDVAVQDAGTQAPVDIALDSVSGDIRLVGGHGNITAKTVSGDASIQECQATTVQAQAVSGNLHIGLKGEFNGTLTASTVSGDVTATLPQGSNYRYTLDTQSGDLTAAADGEGAVRTEKLCSGVVGTGAGNVAVHTLSGDIGLSSTPSGE